MLELSPDGAAVCLRSSTDVLGGPVTLRLPGGEIRAMRCIWQNGPHVGLMAVKPDPRIAPAG